MKIAGWPILIVLLALAASASADIQYTVIDLGTFGGPGSLATAINASGQVVGSAQSSDSIGHPFLYSGGQLIDISVTGTTSGHAFGINALGEVVGYAAYASGTHAFLLNQGSYTDLGTLGGPDSFANAINNAGQIVGYSHATGQTASNPNPHAFLYQNGQMTDLTPGSLSQGGRATAINSGGTVTLDLTAGIPDGNGNSAALYANGTRTAIAMAYSAVGINDSGHIVGEINGTISHTPFDAYLFSNGVMHDLGTAPGSFPPSLGESVNSFDDVVGFSQGSGSTAAFVYHPATGMSDLTSLIDPTLGIKLTDAVSINDAGQIAANGTNAAGQNHAFLLTPVPEPSAAVILSALATQLLRRRVRPGQAIRRSRRELAPESTWSRFPVSGVLKNRAAS